jgi:hypothetical protein
MCVHATNDPTVEQFVKELPGDDKKPFCAKLNAKLKTMETDVSGEQTQKGGLDLDSCQNKSQIKLKQGEWESSLWGGSQLDEGKLNKKILDWIKDGKWYMDRLVILNIILCAISVGSSVLMVLCASSETSMFGMTGCGWAVVGFVTFFVNLLLLWAWTEISAQGYFVPANVHRLKLISAHLGWISWLICFVVQMKYKYKKA